MIYNNFKELRYIAESTTLPMRTEIEDITYFYLSYVSGELKTSN